MSVGGLSKGRLGRLRDVMAGHVERGEVPGLVTLVSRRGEVHVEAIGAKAVGERAPIRRDTIFRISSMSKPDRGGGGDDPGGGMPVAAGRAGRSAAAGGLVSTVDDYLAFGRMVLNKGQHGRERILARPSVETLTTDQLTPEQKAVSELGAGFFDNHGWGFGVSIVTRRDAVAAVGRAHDDRPSDARTEGGGGHLLRGQQGLGVRHVRSHPAR